MVRATRAVALCGLLIALRAVPVAAEWQFAPFVGFTFKGGSSFILDPNAINAVSKHHWNLGGTVRLVGAGPLGVEAIVLYVPGFFETDDTRPLFPETQASTTITESRTLALMGNVVLTTPRAWNQYGLRPFVSGGLGLLHAFNNDFAFPVRANVLGYNVGGGAVGLLTDRVGLRFDLRYYRHLPPGKESSPDTPNLPTFGDRVHLHYWTAGVGIVFKY